jgi:hypothetical protein
MGRRRVVVTALLGVAISGVLAADAMLVTQRGVTTPVTLRDALERFRGEMPSRTPAGTVRPRARTAEPVPSPASTTASSARRRRSTATGTATLHPPANGVYAYRTNGYEEISTTSARHDYPSESFATVRRGDGCAWEFEHRVVEQHVDTARYCTARDRHALRAASTAVTFFGQSGTRTYTCDPPLTLLVRPMRAGAVFTGSCETDDGNARSDERVTVVGSETVVVAGVDVAAWHIVEESTLSGETQGSGRIEMWLDAASGLPLRVQRAVDTRTSSGFGTVRYTERATFVLESVRPQT